MDMLSGVLRSLRLNASIYCAMDLSAPWGISLPKSAWAPFHLVESGSCWLLSGKGKRVRLEAGDLVVLFNSEGHALCDDAGSRPDPLETILQHKTSEGVVRFGGGGSLTRLVCGKFALDAIEGRRGVFGTCQISCIFTERAGPSSPRFPLPCACWRRRFVRRSLGASLPRVS